MNKNPSSAAPSGTPRTDRMYEIWQVAPEALEFTKCLEIEITQLQRQLSKVRAELSALSQQLKEAQAEADDSIASKLIDAWCADKGRQIPWAKAIQIVAIVTKQSDAERDRLLHLGDEDGSCEMCGRGALSQQAAEMRARLLEAYDQIDCATGDADLDNERKLLKNRIAVALK